MIVIKCLHSEWKRKKNRLKATELSEVCGIPSTIPPSTFLIKINFLFRLIHDSEKPRFKTFWHIPSHRLCSTVDELGFLVIKKHWACLCSLVSSLTYRRLHPVCWSFNQLFSNNLVKWISATKVKSPEKKQSGSKKNLLKMRAKYNNISFSLAATKSWTNTIPSPDLFQS